MHPNNSKKQEMYIRKIVERQTFCYDNPWENRVLHILTCVLCTPLMFMCIYALYK